LATVVIAHLLQMWMTIDEGPVLAIAYDMLPLALFAAPLVAVLAVASSHMLLAAFAALLTVYHLVLVVPRTVSDRIPRWARSAPRLRLAVANVYVDNATPGDAARQLVESDADVIVIAEATPEFMHIFGSVGGDAAYPHIVSDPDDTSDYAIAIASRLPLEAGSALRIIGPLRLAVAEVEVGGIRTTIAALNPRSTFDTEGQKIWKAQMEQLKSYVPTVQGPLVVAGDLNTTGFRPQFDELLRVGLVDAIDSLGQAWKPSFSLKSVWPLGALGVVARLDQALVNDRAASLSIRNLHTCGSDHVPFVITVVVR
jgi:endonuclease/exonuclease/phosphatase (EEP) superfamily protein YafD